MQLRIVTYACRRKKIPHPVLLKEEHLKLLADRDPELYRQLTEWNGFQRIDVGYPVAVLYTKGLKCKRETLEWLSARDSFTLRTLAEHIACSNRPDYLTLIERVG